MSTQAATARSLEANTVTHEGWGLAGLLATHLGLGVVWALGSGVMIVGKYLFVPTPGSVEVALGVAFLAWFVAGAAAVFLWATIGRFAFVTSFAWAGFAWILMIAVVAASPAPPSDGSWCC